MQMRKKTLATQVAAAAITASAIGFSAPALSGNHDHGLVDLTAGIELSNMYLYRGENLGDPSGLGLIAGWLEADISGAYLGVWATSGDSGGTEYDLYAGYGFDLTDEISVDLNITNFIFPNADSTEDQDGFGDFTEVGLGISAYGADLVYYNNIAGDSGYQYYALGYGIGSFSALVGVNDFDNDDDDFTHLDVTYQFNDELSFTVSQVVDYEDDAGKRKTTFISAMYALDFDL